MGRYQVTSAVRMAKGFGLPNLRDSVLFYGEALEYGTLQEGEAIASDAFDYLEIPLAGWHVIATVGEYRLWAQNVPWSLRNDYRCRNVATLSRETPTWTV
jgi:hypothetical protein